MITNNSALYSMKILADIGREIIFFPLWWYSRGLILIAEKLLAFLSDRQKSLGLWVWIKNIYRPMYQQYDWQGMLISFFMRLVMIIFRATIMLFWVIIALAVFIAWVVLPVYIAYEIMFQLNVI